MIPAVTVLMPVYNGEKYITQAIDSILAQTFRNFEFLIINDGSTDNSRKIVQSYKDKRIRLVENRENIEDNRLFPTERLRTFFPKYAKMKHAFTGMLMEQLLWNTIDYAPPKKETDFHVFKLERNGKHTEPFFQK